MTVPQEFHEDETSLAYDETPYLSSQIACQINKIGDVAYKLMLMKPSISDMHCELLI